MKNLLTGIISSILPIYSFFSWIYVFNKYPKISHSDRINEYNKMFFNIEFNQVIFGIINIILLFISIIFLIKSVKTKNILIKVTSSIFILLSVFILFYNVWGLL